MAVYVVTCIGGSLLLKRIEDPALWMKHLATGLTIAPIFAVFWLIWRYVQETDEYSRLQQLQALSLAGMVSAATAGTVGFLELYDVIPVGAFPIFLLLPIFLFSYGIAKWLRGNGEGCA